jgi:hypothetical protein
MSVITRICFFAALILAIPTWGVSLVAYFCWRFFALRVRPALALASLDDVEKAILIVGTRHPGSLLSTAIEEVNHSRAMEWLIEKNVSLRTLYEPERVEFQVPIGGRLYDVVLSRAPSGPDGLFRVSPSEPWLDEVYSWLRPLGIDMCVSKLDLPTQSVVRAGAAHAIEYMYKTPNRVPANIYRLHHLQTLQLIYKSIVALPPSISKLSKLEELKLGGNNLTELPDEVCDLEGLKLLTVWGNPLKRLPHRIGNLRQLEGLDISGDEIRSLPESIVELGALKRFYLLGQNKLLLSDRQERWLARLIEGGTEVLVEPDLADRLCEMHPHLAQMMSSNKFFNTPVYAPSEADVGDSLLDDDSEAFP